ncbi:UPF0481 protein At3g47200-like [Ziziphus jujuba]|uniref:UPF0481 protein At3g47200-like n=1 Tax=Ziziphus jujuba TaxID=326968 RepID=A0ABM4A1P2_ZIZJJ|nr:UPF0481 protein At3g47200-like [Ziziphus jujuba]
MEEQSEELTINMENTEGPAPISKNNEGPSDLPPELSFMSNVYESSTSRSNQHIIPTVPEMLRNLKKDEDCFYPSVVSIGPYYHGRRYLKKFEKRKTNWAWQYCKTREGVVNLYNRVKNVAERGREFYNMKRLTSIKEEEFTQMMFLDGCFILEFIIWLLGVKEYYDIGMNNNEIADVKRDLFLLENQLPYIVLEALMEGYKYEREETLKKFITICGSLPPAEKEDERPLHLLDMMRTRFVKQSATFPSRRQVRDMILSALLDKVRHCMGIRSSPKKRATPSATIDCYSYPTARVLNSMGIWFRPNKTGSFGDVKFESQLFIWGVLTLPRILIDASTRSLLLNMLAFESSYTNLKDQQGVTSYMCFMDSLIDNADDVMILRSENVIVNCLGTDQDVADLFNDIASNLVPNHHTYAEAKLGIQKYCNSKFKRCKSKFNIWMSECYNNYFRSPWTFLALCGAISVVLLTAAQTYLAARQLKN